jgi:hypothetical protein
LSPKTPVGKRRILIEQISSSMQPTKFYDPAKEVLRDVFKAFIPEFYYFTPFVAGLVRAWNFY